MKRKIGKIRGHLMWGSRVQEPCGWITGHHSCICYWMPWLLWGRRTPVLVLYLVWHLVLLRSLPWLSRRASNDVVFRTIFGVVSLITTRLATSHVLLWGAIVVVLVVARVVVAILLRLLIVLSTLFWTIPDSVRCDWSRRDRSCVIAENHCLTIEKFLM